jgi:hypothetical protein
MAKMIVGRFDTYQQARATVHDLVNNNVDKERMSLISPNYQEPEASDPQASQGQPSQGEDAAEAAGVGIAALTGVATVAFWGAGLALMAGPLAAIAGAQSDEISDQEMQDRRFEQILIDAGIAASEADARSYVEDVRAGNTFLAVEAADQQEDIVAEIFHRHGGTGLTFRNA